MSRRRRARSRLARRRSGGCRPPGARLGGRRRSADRGRRIRRGRGRRAARRADPGAVAPDRPRRAGDRCGHRGRRGIRGAAGAGRPRARAPPRRRPRPGRAGARRATSWRSGDGSSSRCCRGSCPRSRAGRSPPAYEPAREVGGDLFDVFHLRGRPDLVCLLIADVTGKGIPAALLMADVRALLHAAADNADGPGDALRRVNGILVRERATPLFVTAALLVVDVASGAVRFASAGHEPPLVARFRGGIDAARRARADPRGVRRRDLRRGDGGARAGRRPAALHRRPDRGARPRRRLLRRGPPPRDAERRLRQVGRGDQADRSSTTSTRSAARPRPSTT